MKKALIIGSIFLCFFSSFSQTSKIRWLSMEELQSKSTEHSKPVLIFFNTDWCKICKMQENTTFIDDSIISVINQDFYAVQFNAESKVLIFFFNRSYKFNSSKGFHELAIYLESNEGKIEFPTTVILNQRLELIYRKTGLVDVQEMLKILTQVKFE